MPLPKSWAPSERHQELAEELQVDLEWQAEQFRDHALSKGRTLRDWDKGFNNWLRKAVDFQGRGPPANGDRSSSADEAGPGGWDEAGEVHTGPGWHAEA